MKFVKRIKAGHKVYESDGAMVLVDDSGETARVDETRSIEV